MSGPSEACAQCLRRSWLLVRLAAHLEPVRARVLELLPLSDEDLIKAVGGRSANSVAREFEAFDPGPERTRLARAGVASLCRHGASYPQPLTELQAPPGALFVAGDPGTLGSQLASPAVAIVGSRRAGSYGVEMASSLAGELAGAGLPVISGMAAGVDAAAHRGALGAAGATIAVLAAGPERPYPAANRSLHARIRRAGAIISELPPGSPGWRWAFPARNRIIAGLAAMTIVVEAGEGSGALITAEVAGHLGRTVGAVPGRVGSPGSVGPHALLADGARIVRGAQDVLDALFGVGQRRLEATAPASLSAREALLLQRIAAGLDADSASGQVGLSAEEGLAQLTALELAGHLRRGAGGGFTVTT